LPVPDITPEICIPLTALIVISEALFDEPALANLDRRHARTILLGA
jgi:hypothetical protein